MPIFGCMALIGGLVGADAFAFAKPGRAAGHEWTLSNGKSGMHRFYIHMNRIFVTHINGEELADASPLRRWQDEGPLSRLCDVWLRRGRGRLRWPALGVAVRQDS